MRSVLAAILAFASSAQATAPSCPTGGNAPLSCHNTTAISNTCCTEVQGQVLQVQFWDTDPATGPADHWTIHGLWPDNCDGTYEESCDPSRAYTNISCILEAYDRVDLLAYIEKYWKNDNGEDEELWEHEWETHGTCYSTLQPDCFSDYRPQEEVVDYIQQVVDQFQQLPTYEWLADAGITPSSSKTYTEAEIQAALSKPRGGYDVTLECDDDALYQVEYTFYVQGSIADGVFEAGQPVGQGNGCPASGIKYLPKDLSTAPKVDNTEKCAASLSQASAEASSIEKTIGSTIATATPAATA